MRFTWLKSARSATRFVLVLITWLMPYLGPTSNVTSVCFSPCCKREQRVDTSITFGVQMNNVQPSMYLCHLRRARVGCFLLKFCSEMLSLTISVDLNTRPPYSLKSLRYFR